MRNVLLCHTDTQMFKEIIKYSSKHHMDAIKLNLCLLRLRRINMIKMKGYMYSLIWTSWLCPAKWMQNQYWGLTTEGASVLDCIIDHVLKQTYAFSFFLAFKL